jgi:hypothetical protein
MRAVWLAAFAMACDSGQQLPTDDGSNSNPQDDCPIDEFAVGAEKVSPGGVTVTLTDAVPAPPYKGENTWTFRLSDAEGADTGLAPVLTPWMPLHGHGLVPPDYTGAESDPGVYVMPPFNLTMPGQWEFTVDVGGGDSVVYTFCVEG